jgi:hypothetical protein
MKYKFTPKETIVLENILLELDRKGQLPEELQKLELSLIDYHSIQNWI